MWSKVNLLNKLVIPARNSRIGSNSWDFGIGRNSQGFLAISKCEAIPGTPKIEGIRLISISSLVMNDDRIPIAQRTLVFGAYEHPRTLISFAGEWSYSS